MKKNIAERLTFLREVMRREKIDAFIIPSGDAHHSEYVADHWKSREWISGFTGSAGTAVITMNSAALWTDSRYFLQANEQLANTEYQLMKMAVDGTPSIEEWLGRELSEINGATVAIDGAVCTIAEAEVLTLDLRKQGGITLRTNIDPMALIWKDRPALPKEPIRIQPIEWAGCTTGDKLAQIRRKLANVHADGMLVSALDDIAWTLNLRGADIPCNPVFIAYLIIAPQGVTLFTECTRLTPEVKSYLEENHIELRPYGEIGSGLAEYFGYSILMDSRETAALMPRYVNSRTHIINAPSPIPAMKAVKNQAEINGFRKAMISEGIAMSRLLMWLKPAVERGGVTEISVDEKLHQLRQEDPQYIERSFETIAAYQAHGAIVHYEATPETDVELRPEGFLLLDCGGQYVYGTTDITRTIPLGPITDEQRKVYTLVLKAHIGLETAIFPTGASGTQIDALARAELWKYGYNYLHGTGHGVGAHLCVHEGPQQIRMEYKPKTLEAGMTITDEPGVYLDGRFGVRIENVLLICDANHTECADFLRMEPLTLCPIDTTAIDTTLLNPEEIEWLNNYHQQVYNTLAPHLEPHEKQWLAEATAPLEQD